MIASLLEFSLRQRMLVLSLACLLSVVGIFAFQSIPIDAYPDVTNIQVQVLTEASGLSPIEVERFITYPLELQLTGLPGMEEIRSLSKFALSQITVVFRDDIDIYFARQLVLERIMAAREQLPEGLDPVMAPVTTGLGEVYQERRNWHRLARCVASSFRSFSAPYRLVTFAGLTYRLAFGVL
jgi:cobalt-zinc-cadmium resistance protein CzcA